VALAVCSVAEPPEVLAAFERLVTRPYAWLLDSALRSPRLGRFSFAGADPWLVLRGRGSRVEIECLRPVRAGLSAGRTEFPGDVLEVARALLPRVAPGAGASMRQRTGWPADIPFAGGAIGAFAYELGARFERVPLRAEGDLGLPDACLLFVDRVLACDHRTGRCVGLGLGFGAGPREARAAARAQAEAAAALEPAGAPAACQPRAPTAAAGADLDEAGHTAAARAILHEIAAGNVYQANLTRRIARRCAADPWAVYRALRRRNPAPFACFLALPEAAVLGSSPERFLRLEPDRRVESRPIKGTAARGRDAAADADARDRLLASAKDRAENLMIVDLVRNDLGRVCETGSVEVPELMAVEAYASVFQMVSTVTGRLRADRDVFDLLRAAFPPGSMTGAPKLAAMRLLARLEPVRRGFYSGAIGWLDARGGADLSVVIRTLLVQGERAFAQTGGGIVADSDPRAEWRESVDKVRPLLAALDETDPGAARDQAVCPPSIENTAPVT
jgi:para-aminobenzoate synthetase component 1